MANFLLCLVTLPLSSTPAFSQIVSTTLLKGCDPLEFENPLVTVTTSKGESLPVIKHQLVVPLNISSFTINCTFHKPVNWQITRNPLPTSVVISEAVRHFPPFTWASDNCYSTNLIFPEVHEEITGLYKCSEINNFDSDPVEVQLYSDHRSKNSMGYLLRRGRLHRLKESQGNFGIFMQCQVTLPSVPVQFYYALQLDPNATNWTIIPSEFISYHPVKGTTIKRKFLDQSYTQFFLKCETNIPGDYYIHHHIERTVRLDPKPGDTETLILSTSARQDFVCEAKYEINMTVVESIPDVNYDTTYTSTSNKFRGTTTLSYLGGEASSRKVGVVQCNFQTGMLLHSWRHKLFDDPQLRFTSVGFSVDPKTRRVTCVTIAVRDAQFRFIISSTPEQAMLKQVCNRVHENITCPEQTLLSPVESTLNSISVRLPPVSGKISCYGLDVNDGTNYFLNTDETTISILPHYEDLAYAEHASHEISCSTRNPKVAQAFQCKCAFTKRLFALPIIPAITGNNHTLQLVPYKDVPFTYSEFQELSFYYKVFRITIPSSDVQSVSCIGFNPRSPKHYFANWTITPKQHELNLESHTEEAVIEIPEDQTTINVSCVASSYPTPQITWNISEEIFAHITTKIFNDSKDESNNSFSTIESTLIINVEDAVTLQQIQCVADVNQTSVGGDIQFLSKTFRFQRNILNSQSQWSQTTIAAVSISSIAAFILLLSVLFLVIRVKYQKPPRSILSNKEIDNFLKGNPNIRGDNGYENAQRMPFAGTKYQLDMTCLQIDHENILGSGAYGVVLKGSIQGTSSSEILDVAVKMVKPDTEIDYLKALLGELKVMTYIGNHPHIAELVGAITTRLTKCQLFVVLRYYSNGSLSEYLLKNRKHFVNNSTNDPNNHDEQSSLVNYTNCISVRKTITPIDLVQWSYEIALGMEYLVSKKVIHGDIAARNILLDETRQAKISDFGLARQLYNYSLYVKKSKVPLPWRWLSIEAMCDMAFSHKSDIWAFGVTVWEIFSLGELPYPGITWDSEFTKLLKNGFRLSKPDLSTQHIYNIIMFPTWNLDPETRPSFIELSRALENLLRESCNVEKSQQTHTRTFENNYANEPTMLA